ncbi:hypothetical protein H0H93_011838 [Arthromyces matolae]|nr:hypothetical protein H0H93_011838 [Arthromyces matolae]
MLLTQGILFAYFLLTFLATATPIPTSLQLLPRSLPELPSDTLFRRDAAVSSSLAPGGKLEVRDTSEVMPHIGVRNAEIVPQEARTTAEIERRMEGSASETVKDAFGTEYESGSLEFFLILFLDLGDYTVLKKSTKMEFAQTLRRIALHLPNIHDLHVIEGVAWSLMHDRVGFKTIIGDWPSDSASKHSQEQTIAVKAIQDWEQKLETWTKEEKLKKGQRFLPLSEEAVMKILTCIIKAEDKDPEFMKKMLSPLPAAVLRMSINDSRKIHADLVKVAKHVQDRWISPWGPDVKSMSQDQRIVIDKLGELKNILSTFFVSSLVATATPIPTPTQPLPRSLSELPSNPLLTRVTADSSSLPPAVLEVGVAPSNLKVTPYGVPEVVIAGQMEKRTSDDESSRGVEMNGGPPKSLEFFRSLFKQVEEFEKSDISSRRRNRAFGGMLSVITKALDNIEDKAFPLVLHFLFLNRTACKAIIGDWGLGSRGSVSMRQIRATNAIRGWENAFEKWTEEGKLRIFHPELAKKEAEDNIKWIKESFIGHQPAKDLLEHLVDLRQTVLKMSIKDTQELHKQLGEAMDNVQSHWISKWLESGQNDDDTKWRIIYYLRAVKRYNMVFGSTTTTPMIALKIDTMDIKSFAPGREPTLYPPREI